jgi:hypothetical protein
LKLLFAGFFMNSNLTQFWTIFLKFEAFWATSFFLSPVVAFA